MENQTFFEQYRYHLIGAGVFLAALTGVIIWQVRERRKSRTSLPVAPPDTRPVSSRSSPSGFCQHQDYPLRYGSCHPDVRPLQRALKYLGADLGNFGPHRDGIDGKFGNKTLAALKAKFGRDSVSQTDMARVQATLRQWESNR